MSTKRKIDDIGVILVSIENDAKPLLFVLLSRDGSINRMGDGSLSNKHEDMHIGMTRERMFEQLLQKVDESWLQHLGHYEVPDRKGVECELTVLFQWQSGDESGIQFIYGSESQGPPEDIVGFVHSAVRVTQPWFERQVSRAARNESRAARTGSRGPVKRTEGKPWWKFW